MINNRVLLIGATILIVIIVWMGFSKNVKLQLPPKENQSQEASTAKDNKSGQAEAAPSNTSAQASELYTTAVALRKDRQFDKAKVTYQKILMEYPDFERVEQVEKELGQMNIDIIFSNAPTEHSVIHEVIAGDTLGELAKRYGTTVELIKINNNLKNDVIRLGQRLRIWTGQFNIFVDKSQNILILKQGDEVLKVYDVSTGLNSSTPVGEFKITTKLIDPVWFNRGVVVPPESPQNVLGTRWLGFDIQGYGIHGTVEPETIGQAVTAGCVRMRNKEVEELYSFIPMGTKVVIVD